MSAESNWRADLRGLNPLKIDVKQDLVLFLNDFYPYDKLDLKTEDSEDSSGGGGGGGSDDSDDYSGGGGGGGRVDWLQRAQEDSFVVRAFALTEEGQSVSVDMVDFKPYFYIKIPDTWKKYHLDKLMDTVRGQVYYQNREGLLSARIVKGKPYSHFTGHDQFQFAKLVFNNYKSFRSYSFVFYKPVRVIGLGRGAQRYPLYESNITPLLRLLHAQDINPSGWIRLPRGKYRIVSEWDSNATTQAHIEISYRWIESLKDRWEIPPIVYASYDIEADSSHGDFPLARKTYKKLARDIVSEFNRLAVEQPALIEDKSRTLILRWLELAFDDYYRNNHINRLVTVGGVGLDVRDGDLDELIGKLWSLGQQYLKMTRESGCQLEERIDEDSPRGEILDQVHFLLEGNLPELDLEAEGLVGSDYRQLAYQLLKEMERSVRIKAPVFRDSPKQCLRCWLKLAFDPVYDDHEISAVYTKKNRKPADGLLGNLTPKVLKICQASRRFLSGRAEAEDTDWFGNGGDGDGDAGGGEADKIDQDTFVDRLDVVLSKYLPPVQGDVVTQIGTTFKRYGGSDCFLKHIITLDTCDPITNEEVIADEHKNIDLPKKLILGEIKKWAKAGLNEDGRLSEGLISMVVDMVELGSGVDLAAINAEILNQRYLKQMETDKSVVVVESYATEVEVLLAWTRLIRESDPDMIIGYNVFGFDFKYMYQRAEELGCVEEFSQLGRIKEISQELAEQKLSSSGLGDNLLYYIDMFGRVLVDLYKVVQSNYKLPMYKLDYVCKEFMYMSKNDLPPKELFILQKGTAADRKTIACYCLIDCILCNRLIDKLEIITNNIGMSNVCTVPLSYLFLRGQGIKILSLVSKICQKEGYFLPVLKKPRKFGDKGGVGAGEEDQEGYEGAIVLDAKKDIYFEASVVADFNSLYPSCMIAENLSHDSYVIQGSKWDNLEDFDYVDIDYDIYEEQPIPGRKKTRKVKVGVKTCRFAQPPNGEKSMLPRILQHLLKARKDTRKEQKKFPKGSFRWNVHEGLQLAFKITANSLYGQTGARTSAIYKKDIAACTTASGRTLIHFSRDFYEDNYPGCKTIYGDSVTADTPILAMNANGMVEYLTLEELGDGQWIPYHDTKEVCAPRPGYTVWSDMGFTEIKKVIRHRTDKEIFRVLTHTGVVDVTSDHSLLDASGNKITPNDTKVGDELLHKDLFVNPDDNTDGDPYPEQAFIMGLFYADGSCGRYGEKSKVKYTWALNNADMALLEKALSYCHDYFPEMSFRILDTMKSSNVYKLVAMGDVKEFVNRWRPNFYCNRRYKRVPTQILNASIEIKKAFLEGYYAGDGDKDKNGYYRFDNKGKIGAAGLYYLANCVGYNASINCRNDKPEIYRITCTRLKQRRNPISVKKIVPMGTTDEYVYDLETENHHFSAGIGRLVCHNTDSVFEKFDCKNVHGEKLYGLDSIYKSMELCMEGAIAISRQLKRPHNLEFEKVIWPFILLSKKRYHGHYYTEFGAPNYFKKSMGIVLKRRDNADIVKHVFGGILDIIMKEHDLDKALVEGQKMVEKLLRGEYPLDMFVVTKSLRSYYKNPKQIAHAVLAKRIAKRDPGNKPQSNDRMAYAYVTLTKEQEAAKKRKEKVLQGDRIETPDFIKEHGVDLDYKFYLTNQIMKPVMQIFDLKTDKGMKMFIDPIRDYDYRIRGIRKITEWFDVKKADPLELEGFDFGSDSDSDDSDSDLDLDLEDEEAEDRDVVIKKKKSDKPAKSKTLGKGIKMVGAKKKTKMSAFDAFGGFD